MVDALSSSYTPSCFTIYSIRVRLRDSFCQPPLDGLRSCGVRIATCTSTTRALRGAVRHKTGVEVFRGPTDDAEHKLERVEALTV